MRPSVPRHAQQQCLPGVPAARPAQPLPSLAGTHLRRAQGHA